jgi:hypothetical protein
VGDEEWIHNPRIVVPGDYFDFVRLWVACRGEAGIAHWPDAGGVADQAAWLIDGFAALGGIDAQWREDARKGGGT